MFIINHAQKFKYQPGQMKVELTENKQNFLCIEIHCPQW
jgi:hypothetical protein